MRVATDDLVADRAHDSLEIELSPLLGDPRLKHDLEQQISELLAEIPRSARGDRLQHLVGLLDDEGAEALEGLLAIQKKMENERGWLKRLWTKGRQAVNAANGNT